MWLFLSSNPARQYLSMFSSWHQCDCPHEWHFPKNKLSFVLAVSSKQAAGSQEWFVGMMCAVALLTLLVLIGCFVLKNKGGKYAGKTRTALEVTQSKACSQSVYTLAWCFTVALSHQPIDLLLAASDRYLEISELYWPVLIGSYCGLQLFCSTYCIFNQYERFLMDSRFTSWINYYKIKNPYGVYAIKPKALQDIALNTLIFHCGYALYNYIYSLPSWKE